MFTSTRTARALLALAALSLGGCAKLLGDFTYDPNDGQTETGTGGKGSGEQGDIVILPPDGLVTTEQGAKATFTIALKVKPTANVAIALQSSNEKEGRVSPISVSFTPENYAAPQTVQVTGVDDTLEDRTQTYEIVTSPGSSQDPHYNGLDPLNPELKNVDDETAGFLLAPTTGLVTTESGGEATFTVVLTHQPTADVLVPLSSDKETEGTVSPPALTFTAENWMAPQIVTVTGANDDAADGAVTYHVVTGEASSADSGYDKLDPDDATVVNQDNDTAGVMLTPGTGLITFENGAMTSFGIALNSPPAKDVTIALISSDPGEGVVTPERVEFTALNWMAPQIVTVTGVDDERPDGNQPYLVRTAIAESDDPAYNGFDGPDAEIVNIDDDSPGLVVTPTFGLVTSELGSSTTFTVSLASKPDGDVLLDVASSRVEEGVVTPPLLTFTELNWEAPQVVTVTGVDDAIADGMQTYAVHVTPKLDSVDTAYVARLQEVDVNLSNTDDDSAGITVIAGSGLTTTEAGGSAIFTVALNSQPTKDVTIDLSSSNPAEGTVSPAKLVFTHDNYQAPQVVTIKGVSDDMQDGNQPYRIITSPAVSKDLGYAGIDASNVDVRNTDDDSAGITVKPDTSTQRLTTSESGGTATFTVVLTSQPLTGTEVNVPVSTNKPAEGTVNVGNLKFTGDNWRAPQTVTVKGVDDDKTADGNQNFLIVLGKAESADTHYSVIDPPDVRCSNTDNDSAGFTVTVPNGGLTTRETGAMATFTIALNSKPTADVTIPLSSSNGKEGTVTPASLKFTPANFGAPQTVTVTGVNDDVADGNQSYRVNVSASGSQDPNYNAKDPTDVNVTNLDDDSPGIAVTFTPATGLATKEDGTSASFTIQLLSQPTADVTVPLRSSNTKEGTLGAASLTFTTANWKSARTVTVTGVDDAIADSNQPYSILVDPATSTDAKYKGLDAMDVPMTNVDDDSPGIDVTPVTGNTKENGTTASFTIALESEPRKNVTIALSSSNIKEGTVSPGSVTFTPLNWKAPQKVTITGVNDEVADGNAVYTIAIAPAVSDDAGYKGLDAPDVSLSNVDDDSAGVSVTAAKGATSEDGATTTFTIVLESQPTANVTIPLTSSNPDEGTVSVAQVVFTTTDYRSAKTVTITGVDDMVADGPQQYSIIVGAAVSTDKGYSGKDAGDVVVINSDNDSADLKVSATSGTTGEKANAAAFTFTIALTSKPSADVSIPLTSSDETEGTVSPAKLTFTSANWKSGQTVTVTGVNDDMADGSQVYKVQIGAATSTDKGYSGLDYPTDVIVTNLDDDSAGVDVSKAAGSTSEKGATTTFTIVLRSQPGSNVTIPLTSSNEDEGTLTVTSVVFTKENWNSAQTVIVHGQNDKIADGSQSYSIRTGPAMSSDNGYNGYNADDVDVINIDDDVAGIEVSAAAGKTSEAGGTPGATTFTVVLSSQPKAAVSIPISSSNIDEGTLDLTKVDFTTSNWSTPQTITIHGVDDDIADGPQSYTIVLSKPTSTDAAYAAIDPDDVAVINDDNDSAGIKVSATLISIAESGTSKTFEIVLGSQPKADVTIPLHVSDETEAKLDVTSVTFTSANWKTAKQVKVTGVDDQAADGTQTTKVVIDPPQKSEDSGYRVIDPPDVTIETVDDDSASIIVNTPTETATGEAAGSPTVTFTVVLTSAPSATVTISVASNLDSEGIVTIPATGSLIFDGKNWDKPQSVTVVGEDDDVVDPDHPYSIILGPSVSADADYDDKNLAPVKLTNVDNDGGAG